MNSTGSDEIANSHFTYVTTAQLAFYVQIEHGAVASSMCMTQPKPDGPYLLKFQRSLSPDDPAGIPRTTIFSARLII